MGRGGFARFGLSEKVNFVLISGLLAFLAVASVQQSRHQHALVKTLNAGTGTVVNELASQMAADRAECESMMENAMADVVAKFAPDLVAGDDVSGLQGYADLLARTPNVDAVQFLDPGGHVIAGASEPMAGDAMPAMSAMPAGPEPSHYVLERPIESHGRILGTFRMVVTDRFLRVSAEASRHTAANAMAKSRHVAEVSLARADLTMALSSLVLAVLMAALSTVLFQRQIGRPLGAITMAMQKLAAGQMGEVIPGAGRRDEIGAIAAASEVFKDSMIRTVQLAEANAQLSQLSSTDGLTGIANRRAFDAALAREWSREGTQIALLMIDVDFFKLYNDRYGHLAGDDCLCDIAGHLTRALLRPGDLAARYGGEEFAALLANTDEKGARKVAERLRASIEAAALPHAAAPLGHVSVSIGIASLASSRNGDCQALIRLADAALYDAKHGGRNQVRGPSDGLPPGSWSELGAADPVFTRIDQST